MPTFVSGREGENPFLLTCNVEHMVTVGGRAKLGSQEPALTSLCRDSREDNCHRRWPECSVLLSRKGSSTCNVLSSNALSDGRCAWYS